MRRKYATALNLLLHLHEFDTRHGMLRLLLHLHGVKGKIPRQEQDDVASGSIGSDVGIHEKQYRIDGVFFLGGAIGTRSEEDEAEGHDRVELLSEWGVGVGRHVFTEESDELFDFCFFGWILLMLLYVLGGRNG